MEYQSGNIRNIAIAGHGQTGKTTLLEHILFTNGIIPKAETIDSGKTVSDFSPEETTRKISIRSALAHIDKHGVLINIWDTPGVSDFNGEVTAAFRSSETALMLMDGRIGIQIETVKLWRDLDRRNKARVVFINHCEDERADVMSVTKSIHAEFGAETCAVTIPMGTGSEYKGVIDVLNGSAYFTPEDGKTEQASAIPEEYMDAYKNALGIIAGAAAEGDDDLLVKFIDEGELTRDEIISGLKTALENNRIVPVFAGCPLKNSGITPLLDFITDIAPSPLNALETAIRETGERLTIKIQEQGSVYALAVKTAGDQFSGKLSYIKLISGNLKSDSDLYNISSGKKEKIGKLFRCVGKKLIEIQQLHAGDIGIAAKLASVKTGDTLAAAETALPFVPLRHPEPVYAMAVRAKEKKDQDKLGELLARATEEDQTISFVYNTETKQNVLSGMGELHIAIILERISSQNKIQIETSIPRIAYRETIQRKSQAEYTHKKQSGGHGQYGRVVLSIEPLERGNNYQFTNAVFGGAISKSYIPGVEKGVKEAMEHGVLARYPMVDIGVTVLDGKEHPVDSSELAFKVAARNAFKNAAENAGPILLEPIMNITVWVESKYLGDIMSDLSGRRGRILGQNQPGNGIEEIRAQVPQAELLKYAIDLRSKTSGTGSFETSFDHYAPVSGKAAENIILEAKKFNENTVLQE